MNKIKKIVASVVVATLSFSIVGCKMIEKTPEAIKNTVLATVGKEKITQGDLDRDLKSITESLKQKYGEDYKENADVKDQLKQLKTQYLNAIVNEKVILAKSSELNLRPSDEEVNKEVDETVNYYKNAYKTEEEYKAFLEQNEFTEDEFKEYQKNQAIVRYVYNDMVKDVEVTDDDIQKYYDGNKDTQFTTKGEINFDKSLQDAKDIKSQLDGGADFAQLAKEKSQDPGTKDNGGSLGFIEYSSTKYVKEFMDGVKSLKEGEISEPIKSQFGYHIIKVTGVKDNGAEVSHILIADRGEGKVTPLEDVKEDIRGQLLQTKKSKAFNEKIEEWKKDIGVKIYDKKL
ncbi:peptidylprolyl isomerase [Clostridium taeniosporum]|uniref:peptidylprolyl isomerase n=1 Tax=Clostridium taeniosporum TaxID=394958 RepID=A0A1D7XG62_9CLOT|nr:peptidylprolyl isomerase [Clostridium taeniosporum]AOR22337.1 peptidylprolyl isomerase [Clostridium taeniosporum]